MRNPTTKRWKGFGHIAAMVLVFFTASQISPLQYISVSAVNRSEKPFQLENLFSPRAHAGGSQMSQMCMMMVSMFGMLMQMKASSEEQKAQQTMAYLQSGFKADLARLFSPQTSRDEKIAIQKRLLENTPLTKEQLDQLRKLNDPAKINSKLQEISSQLQSEVGDGIESASNKAMMMIIIGMILCAMLPMLGALGGGGAAPASGGAGGQ